MTIRYKAIIPKKLNMRVLDQEIRSGMHKIGRQVRNDFRATVRTWDGKPDFELKVSVAFVRRGNARMDIGPIGDEEAVENWLRQQEGTKPHVIRPKQASRLIFSGTYRAKTTPRVLGSGPGGSSGPLVVAREVRHPGTEAREWIETAVEKWQEPFVDEMNLRLSAAAKKSGHSI